VPEVDLNAALETAAPALLVSVKEVVDSTEAIIPRVIVLLISILPTSVPEAKSVPDPETIFVDPSKAIPETAIASLEIRVITELPEMDEIVPR
jgi:hypothetical protein